MKARNLFVRNVHVSGLLESFLVASVASLLLTRAFLAATGYPQLGRGGLHIAHMLWGGLCMLIAIVLLLAFLGRRIQNIAALLGGIGFGVFIDELGKFITSDNNYFFQPTIAIIYIIFILLFLCSHWLERRHHLTEKERLANALAILQEDVLYGANEKRKAELLPLLLTKDCHDPRLRLLAAAVERLPATTVEEPTLLDTIARKTRDLYHRLVRSPRFAGIVTFFFICYGLVFTLYLLFGVVSIGKKAGGTLPAFAQLCLLASTIVSDIMIVIGVLYLRKEPLTAYSWFKLATLVSIFLTQVFMFYIQQLGAVNGLVVNLILLAGLNYMIYNRLHEQQHRIHVHALEEQA